MQFQTLTLQHNCNGATAQNLQNNISEEHNHIVTNRQFIWAIHVSVILS